MATCGETAWTKSSVALLPARIFMRSSRPGSMAVIGHTWNPAPPPTRWPAQTSALRVVAPSAAIPADVSGAWIRLQSDRNLRARRCFPPRNELAATVLGLDFARSAPRGRLGLGRFHAKAADVTGCGGETHWAGSPYICRANFVGPRRSGWATLPETPPECVHRPRPAHRGSRTPRGRRW